MALRGERSRRVTSEAVKHGTWGGDTSASQDAVRVGHGDSNHRAVGMKDDATGVRGRMDL